MRRTLEGRVARAVNEGRDDTCLIGVLCIIGGILVGIASTLSNIESAIKARRNTVVENQVQTGQD